MQLEGVVQGGVIVPAQPIAAPEGTRVRFELVPAAEAVPASDRLSTFGERYAAFKVAFDGAPADLAEQHDHYRLGTPKR